MKYFTLLDKIGLSRDIIEKVKTTLYIIMTGIKLNVQSFNNRITPIPTHWLIAIIRLWDSHISANIKYCMFYFLYITLTETPFFLKKSADAMVGWLRSLFNVALCNLKGLITTFVLREGD